MSWIGRVFGRDPLSVSESDSQEKLESKYAAATERANQARVQALEAQVDLELLKRRIEDFGYSLVGGMLQHPGTGLEVTDVARKARNEKAELAWREDATIARSVDINNEFVFGSGIPVPAARDPRVQRYIDAFWEDEDNRLVLTSYESQLGKGTELQLYGELFFLVFAQGKWQKDDNIVLTPANKSGFVPAGAKSVLVPDTSPTVPTARDVFGSVQGKRYIVTEQGPPPSSAVKLSHIHPNEIDLIIPDRDNPVRPRYYRRTFTLYDYDFENGQWEDVTPERKRPHPGMEDFLYYESLQYPPNETDALGRPQNRPAGTDVGQGQIVHLAVNKTTFMLRGNSEVWRAVRWAEAMTEAYGWHLTRMQALSTYVFKQRVRGGMRAVLDAGLRLGAGGSGTGVPGANDPMTAPRVGATYTSNESEDLSQFQMTTGAGEFAQNISTLRSVTGVGLGMHPSFLGDVASTLSVSAFQETPVIKMMERRQEAFKRLIMALTKFAVDKAAEDGALAADIDRTFRVELPPLLQRNIPELVAAINDISARLDPLSTNIRLKRWLLLNALIILGDPDPQAWVNDIYPPGMEDRFQNLDPATTSPATFGQFGDPNAPPGAQSNGAQGGRDAIPTPGMPTQKGPARPKSVLDPTRNAKQNAKTVEDAAFTSAFGFTPAIAEEGYMLLVQSLTDLAQRNYDNAVGALAEINGDGQ